MIGLASDVEDTLDLGQELKHLVDNKSDENKVDAAKVATYVKQWRFRSLYGRFHNGECYFNCGSLSGDELIKQFLQVLSGYESASIQIFGLVSDGGGKKPGFQIFAWWTIGVK